MNGKRNIGACPLFEPLSEYSENGAKRGQALLCCPLADMV